jgi:FkbM family methyltransferase
MEDSSAKQKPNRGAKKNQKPKKEGRMMRQNRQAAYYPSEFDITYLSKIDDITAIFMTDDPYSRKWFYPRYAGGKLHEPAASRLLLDILTPENVFIDVGAHLGYFSILAAAKAKKVFAIEALEFLITKIHRNCVANHYTNFHTIYAAAGEKTGFVSVPKASGPKNKVDTKSQESLVPVIRLDDYFAAETAPLVLKIDTEGFEYQILSGAAKILEKKPKLLVEVHRGMRAFGHDRGKLYDLLKGYGYKISMIEHRKQDSDSGWNEVSREEMTQLNNVMVFCE